MSETTSSPRLSDRMENARRGLTALIAEAGVARARRDEVAAVKDQRAGDGGTAVCAWNHFENIPTFYNWNNRPR
ncbi:multiple cyclophane-containing RiPP AmcA [Mangrovihabitans endophyticus]|uniref:Uncharacterized protein n=1 Tax=Mangrovihabitans endophyticus TaxID=1751298 RepID=A0A8J3C1W5_9ACTN|nr:multiple cyclophane-containing RiPP AmcA [Mangrovihabitans endophyticus]GGK95391.1 hypothetical protein GCM10012284_31860 [Mangrovihabitans endophyticus]